MPPLAGFNPDTFMPYTRTSDWWVMMRRYNAFPDTYQTQYVVLLFKGWTFEDFFGDGPPSAGKLTEWGPWEGENPVPGKNWWTENYDNGLFLPVADGTDWVNNFWQIGTGAPVTPNGDWDEWEDIWHGFPVIASDKNKFTLGMASRVVGRMTQLKCAKMLEMLLSLDNRGRVAHPGA